VLSTCKASYIWRAWVVISLAPCLVLSCLADVVVYDCKADAPPSGKKAALLVYPVPTRAPCQNSDLHLHTVQDCRLLTNWPSPEFLYHCM
jgi:hypothetical protein